MACLMLLLIGLCAFFVSAHDPMEDPNLFEGDMILTDDQKRDYLFGDANYQIPLAATKTNLWPKTIPYSMAPEISSASRAVSAINAAIADYEKHTCLRFVKRTTQSGYLYFYKGNGCSSPVGYYRRRNTISLASGCWYKGIVMHEIAHSLGFYHEQSRPDRDQHVTIRWENIPDHLEYNFAKKSTSTIDSLNIPYDYESVMHYGKTAFGSGRITIETKDKSKQNVIGNRRGFSYYDIKQMNLLYKCSGASNVTTSAPVVTTSSCSDKYPNSCPGWKSQGYCTNDNYKNTMKAYCKKTCGYCGGATTKSPTTQSPTTKGCYDSTSSCARWQQSGFCTMDKYKDYMRRNCKKSCGYCPGATTSSPTTQRPTTSGCSDKYPSHCPGWKRSGYCFKDGYKDYMRSNCYKTCGYCGGATTAPPTSPPCKDEHSSCRYWQQKGLCSCLSRFCKKSCGVCTDVTTRPPVTTKPGPVTTKSPVTGSCGQPEVQQSRVIAGENATRGAWPWQILMLFNGRTMCGGSLVSPNWVVTAAHCVSGREGYASYFRVRVGEHTTSTTSDGQHQDIQVEKIISHPSYSRNTINNDIALMKLKTPVKFGKYIKPVCLPNQDQHVPVGTECYITGWGKIQHPGNMHHTLQQGKMPVVSKTACTNMNTQNLGIRITDQMVCAGHGGTTRVSGCHGDSGGPFVCQTGANGRWVLHGAVSWGSGRCDATQGYTVFARVAVFRSWVDQTMASN